MYTWLDQRFFTRIILWTLARVPSRVALIVSTGSSAVALLRRSLPFPTRLGSVPRGETDWCHKYLLFSTAPSLIVGNISVPLLATLRGLAPLDLRPPSSSRGQALGEIADGRRSIRGLYQACKSRRLCVRVGSLTPIAIRSDRSGPAPTGSGPGTHIFLVPESAISSSDSRKTFRVTRGSC